MKKIVIILCALSLLLAFSFAAADGDVYTEGYFYYTISDQSITITGYFGNETVVTVPSSIAGIPVNAIGPGAFANTSVQILYLPDTIRELGENATGTADVRFIGQTPAPTENPPETEIPGQQGSQTTAASGKTPTPAPTAAGHEEVVGAEPPEPTELQATAVPETDNPEQATPAAEASASPDTESEATKAPAEAQPTIESETVEPQDPVEPVTPEKPDEQPKKLTWLWIALGAAAIACGAAAGVLAVKKSKRK